MITFKIKLFGALKHNLQAAEISIQSKKQTLELLELLQEIKQQYPQLNEVSNYKLAVNNTIFDSENTAILSTDEIALLPPYAGG